VITLDQLVVINRLVRKLTDLRIAVVDLTRDPNADVNVHVASFNASHNISLVIANAFVSKQGIIDLITPQVDDIVSQLAVLGVEA